MTKSSITFKKPLLLVLSSLYLSGISFLSVGIAQASTPPAIAPTSQADCPAGTTFAGPGSDGSPAACNPSSTSGGTYSLGPTTAAYYCGGGGNKIYTSIDLGCSHKGNAILDATFAIIRFLSDGAGLVIIGSLIWGGIQYTGSRGDPQATAAAVSRIQNVMIALLLFIFAYAILNYVIPGSLLK